MFDRAIRLNDEEIVNLERFRREPRDRIRSEPQHIERESRELASQRVFFKRYNLSTFCALKFGQFLCE